MTYEYVCIIYYYISSAVIGVSFVAVLVGSSWLSTVYKKRKLMKLKESLFKTNGGLILKLKLIEQ